MTTMKQVAARAGVSVATVSRVLNRSGNVAPDLRERVLEAVRELGYQPSALARGLRRQRTETVGLLVPQIDHPFFGTLLFHLEKQLFERGYRCFACSAEEDPRKEEVYLDALVRQQVDGCLIVPTSHGPVAVGRLHDRGMPLVLLDRDVPGLDVDRVHSDNRSGAAAIARHLVDLGHRHVTIIGARERSVPIHERAHGARSVLDAAGVECDMRRSESLDPFEAGYLVALEVLRSERRPTALMALTDPLAIGAMRAVAQAGLRVPDDMSISGFDDITLASNVNPTLTTATQDVPQLAREAVELLLARVADPSRPATTRVVPSRLVVRHSTGAPRQGGGPTT